MDKNLATMQGGHHKKRPNSTGIGNRYINSCACYIDSKLLSTQYTVIHVISYRNSA